MSKLKTAIKAGDLDAVRALVAAGTDVTAAFADGTTPIQLAARERQITILRALAAAGADVADLDVLKFEERLMLFFDASRDAVTDDDLMDPEELSAWAEQAVAELMDDNLAAEIAAHEGQIFRAVRTGDLELLKERIAAGDLVDQVREVTRDTPLTLAVQGGDEEIIRALIEAGANVSHCGYSTPLSFALPDLRLAKLLLDAGADVYGRGLDRRTPLERAVHRTLNPTCSADSQLLVRFFLEAGVHPPNAESFEGTLLLEAESEEAWELYQELLPHYPEQIGRESFEEIESRQNMQEADGGHLQWTFDLNYAARQGDPDELRELLERRPESEREGDFAKEAGLAVREALLHLKPQAAPQLEVVRTLIAAGADLGAHSSYERDRGSSPLACAAESWHAQSEEVMRLLLDAGCDVDQPGSFDRTPLMFAVLAAYRHGAVLSKAIPLLLAAGADPRRKDAYGHTAWSLAKAPLIEEEERARLGDVWSREEVIFDGPDLSELFSDKANKADAKRSRLDRCRQALELLAAAGADGDAAADGDAELRLMVAATAGDAAGVAALLAAGASPDARGTDGKAAMVAAAESGSGEIVASLIAAGCDVDVHPGGQPSALEVAVRRVDKAMTRQLLDAGANVVMMACMASRALTAAEEAGGGEVVAMIRAALPPEIAYLDRDVADEIAADDLYYDSVDDLPRQAAMGALDKVRELLAVDGVKVDGFDPFRRTALMTACEAGQHEVVGELIRSGAEVGKCNGVVGSPRSTPLACAAIGPSPERDSILRLLLEAGADPDQLGADGRTALMHAVERDVGFFGRTGDFALSTRTLIAAGADLEIRDPYGLTAWMRAMSLAASIEIDEVAEGYESVARLLEEAGAKTDGLPGIELIWEVEVGDAKRVKELLAAGADPDSRRHEGATALILAVRDGRRAIAQLLIDAGCDVDARQWVDRGPTAHAAAVEAGDQKLVRMLVAAGATPAAAAGRQSRSVSPIRQGS